MWGATIWSRLSFHSGLVAQELVDQPEEEILPGTIPPPGRISVGPVPQKHTKNTPLVTEARKHHLKKVTTTIENVDAPLIFEFGASVALQESSMEQKDRWPLVPDVDSSARKHRLQSPCHQRQIQIFIGVAH